MRMFSAFSRLVYNEDMILEEGGRVLIVHRRLFEADHPRYFVGIVDAYEAGVIRVSGYTWVRDSFNGTFARKEELRTKIFSIASGTLIVYQLPSGTDVKAIRFELNKDGKLTLTDGGALKMDLTETVLPRVRAGK